MVRVEKDIWIEAPVERVFAYMDDPLHQAEITPSLSEVDPRGRAPCGGAKAGFVYKMAGVPFRGEIEATRYEPPRRIEFDMRGPLDGRIWFGFEPEGEGTRATYGADYTLPNAALERLARPFLTAYNERECRTVLENLKARMESLTEV